MFVTAVEERDGVLRAKVYDPENRDGAPVALFACVASARGLATLAELVRVLVETSDDSLTQSGLPSGLLSGPRGDRESSGRTAPLATAKPFLGALEGLGEAEHGLIAGP